MARFDQPPVPYPEPAPGTRGRIIDRPVDGPEPDRGQRPKTEREHAGDPSCAACRASATGHCGEHEMYHHAYNPLDSLGIRPAAAISPDDRVRDWAPVEGTVR
jgi:hypothetical protein